MDSLTNKPVSAANQHICRALAWFQIFMSGVVIAGWWLQFEPAVSLLPGFPTMKFNTALMIMLSGVGLLTVLRGHLLANITVAMLLMFISGFTLLQWQLDVDIGIDQLFAIDPFSNRYPGRPSEATAFSGLLASIAVLMLLQLNTRTPQLSRRRNVAREILNLVLMLGSMPSLIGLFTYFYLPEALFATKAFSTMAVHTCVGFLAFYLAASLRYTGSSFREVMFRDSEGGRQFRRMLLPIIVFPMIIGLLLQYAASKQLIEEAFATALFASLSVVVAIVALARSANRQDHWRKDVAEAMRAKAIAESRMSLVWESEQAAVMWFNRDGQVLDANAGATAMFGWSLLEMKEMNLREFLPPEIREHHDRIMERVLVDDNLERLTMDDPERIFGVDRDGDKVPMIITVSKQWLDGELFLGAVMVRVDNLARKMDKLIRDVTIDGLTKAENRRSLDKRLGQLAAFGQRSGKLTAMMMLDIDYFKKVNDTHGHGVGDQVLADFARRVHACLRHGDSLYRYGGEEFVALISCDKPEQSESVARRVMATLQASAIDAGGLSIPITCSIGIAIYGDSDLLPEEVLEQADKALYAAKKAGRNRYICHSWLEDGEVAHN